MSKSKSKGTGVIVSRSGAILTNRHVVSGWDEVWAFISRDWYKTKPGQDHPRDSEDLALLWLNFQPGHAITFRERIFKKGEPVIALGFPLPDQNGRTSMTVNPGNVEAVTGFNSDTSRFEISSGVTFGNSGGPKIDYSGRLGGLVVEKK